MPYTLEEALSLVWSCTTRRVRMNRARAGFEHHDVKIPIFLKPLPALSLRYLVAGTCMGRAPSVASTHHLRHLVSYSITMTSVAALALGNRDAT